MCTPFPRKKNMRVKARETARGVAREKVQKNMEAE